MLQRAASNAYSWWWASHIRTKQSKWLEQNLQDMEEKVHNVMALVSEDGDSFAKRAEMYYKRRPEIIIFVEEAYRAYRALAERYDHISTELQNANNTIAYVFPEQVQLAMDDEDDVPSSRFPKKAAPDHPPKGNIPKVPKIPKEIKGMFQSATKKLQPKKSIKATATPPASKSGFTKPEAFKEIDKLQKHVLVLQTEKEFVKSSYENGLSKYWEIDQHIREIQDKACSLQDEFGAETVIEDDEARSVMTSAALRSCQETLAKLEEKQDKSVEEAKKEKKRIKEAKQKLKSLLLQQQHSDEINPEKGSTCSSSDKEVTAAEEDEEDFRSLEQRREIEVLREKIKKHFEASADASMTVSEMTEKIDELVSKVIGLEAAVSSQAALIQRMTAETDELHGQIQNGEEEGGSSKEVLNEMERKLEEIEEMKENVENQSTNLQTNFMEAKCNLDHLYQKLDSVKPDEDVQTPPPSVPHLKKAHKKANKFESHQQPFVKGKKIRNAVAEFDNSIKKDKEKSEKELKQQQVADEIRKAREGKKKVKFSDKKKKKEKKAAEENLSGNHANQETSDVEVRTAEEENKVSQVQQQQHGHDDEPRVEGGGGGGEGRKDVVEVNAEEEISQRKEQGDISDQSSSLGAMLGDDNSNTIMKVESKEQSLGSLLGVHLDEGPHSPKKHDVSSEDSRDEIVVPQQKSLKKLEKLSTATQEKVEAATATTAVANSTLVDSSVEQIQGRKDADNVNRGDAERQVNVQEDDDVDASNHPVSLTLDNTKQEVDSTKQEVYNSNEQHLNSLSRGDSKNGVQPPVTHLNSLEDSKNNKPIVKQKSTKESENITAETQESVAASENLSLESQENAARKDASDLSLQAQQNGPAVDDVNIKEDEDGSTKPPTTVHNVIQDDNESEDDDEPDWKQLFLKGVENREQVLLTQYTTILRDYKEVQKKLTDVETKEGDSLFDITIQLKELKAANAKKDEQIRALRNKLSLLQAGENDEKPDSPFTVADILQDIDLDLEDGISPVEERFRSSIDELLEDNLGFWLRFSTTFQQVQQFETEVKDLQSELSELEDKLGKHEGSAHGKYSLISDAKPLYKHLREINTELTVWLDKGILLKDELKGRFSSLCEIQNELTTALKESAEDEEFNFTSYQAAKFQGEVLNMKQENNKVADELQAGLDHVTSLQLEVDRTLAKLNEEFKLSGSKNRESINLQHSESRSRVPLRSFIFGVKPKKQKHSFLSVVHPVIQRKYNGFRSGLNL
ncbi:Protein NETWORKED 2D [Linum perenne]